MAKYLLELWSQNYSFPHSIFCPVHDFKICGFMCPKLMTVNQLPHTPFRYRTALSQQLWGTEVKHCIPKFKCQIWDSMTVIYCQIQPCIWQFMSKIQVLLSLLTVVSHQQIWKSFGHSVNEDYTNSKCLGKAWNTQLSSYSTQRPKCPAGCKKKKKSKNGNAAENKCHSDPTSLSRSYE